jgi:hypothetical protein
MKNAIGFVGFVLIVTVLLDGADRFSSLFDWSTAEMVGYNFANLASIFGGAWMVHYSLRKEDKASQIPDTNNRESIETKS